MLGWGLIFLLLKKLFLTVRAKLVLGACFLLLFLISLYRRGRLCIFHVYFLGLYIYISLIEKHRTHEYSIWNFVNITEGNILSGKFSVLVLQVLITPNSSITVL